MQAGGTAASTRHSGAFRHEEHARAAAAWQALWTAAARGLLLPDNWDTSDACKVEQLLKVALWNDHAHTVTSILTYVPTLHGEQLVNKQMQPLGLTLLSFAACRGSCRAAAALLHAKARVNHSPPFQWSDLLQAAFHRHADVMRLLLESKADARGVEYYSDMTTVALAAFGNGGGRYSPDTACLQVLVDAKGDVNAANEPRCLPLMLVAEAGHKNVMRVLLEARAHVDGMGEFTPLAAAVCWQHTGAVAVLLHAKADVHIVDDEGRKPLSHAVESGDARIVKQLLRARADPGVVDSTGCTLLYYAAIRGAEAGVALLLKAKASVDAADCAGTTPLCLAVTRNRLVGVSALLEIKAVVDAPDPAGHTPLFHAAAHKFETVMHMLLEAKADVTTAGGDATALRDACQQRPDAVVALLLAAGADASAESASAESASAENASAHVDVSAP